MARQINKSRLSKSILEMKFMKRTKEKVDKEIENTEGREMYQYAVTPEMMKDSNLLLVDTRDSGVGVALCMGLLCGRRSYRGLNKDVEKLMAQEEGREAPVDHEAKEKEVSDREMASRYNPLVDSMSRKFKPANRKKHKRPSDEPNPDTDRVKRAKR